MLLLPDQTYEQYQGQKTLSTSSPLITLKRILSDTTFCPKITQFTEQKHIQQHPKNTNGKPKPVDRPVKAAAAQMDFNTFFSGIGTKNASNSSKTDRASTPESFKQTCDFFNNIPEFNGEPLGPFSVPKSFKMSHTTADLLKECEILLNKYRIRPDFFCRYRQAMER